MVLPKIVAALILVAALQKGEFLSPVGVPVLAVVDEPLVDVELSPEELAPPAVLLELAAAGLVVVESAFLSLEQDINVKQASATPNIFFIITSRFGADRDAAGQSFSK